METNKENFNKVDTYFEAIGKQARFIRHEKTDSEDYVDVYIHDNSPSDDITTYATLSDSKQELMAVDHKNFGLMDSVLANLKFSLEKDDKLFIGDIIFDVMTYYTTSEMKHLLLMPPFLWGEKLEAKNDLLFVVPISDAEKQFSEDYGVEKLIELLNIYDVDIADLARKSVSIPQLF